MIADESARDFDPRVKDIRGKKFGRLTVVEYAGIDKRGNATWKCACDCGKECLAIATNIIRGVKQSCGCLRGENALKHGGARKGSHEDLYGIWKGIVARTTQPTSIDFTEYGGVGISISKEWLEYEAFKADMGERPTLQHSIDRIKNELGYSKENCRWATKKEQARNRTNTRFLEYKGIRKPIVQWEDELGLTRDVLVRRLKSGMTPEQAIEKPPTKKPRRLRQGLEEEEWTITG